MTAVLVIVFIGISMLSMLAISSKRGRKLSKEWEERENSFQIIDEGIFDHISFVGDSWGLRNTVIHFDNGRAYLLSGWHEYNFVKGCGIKISENLNGRRKIEHVSIPTT